MSHRSAIGLVHGVAASIVAVVLSAGSSFAAVPPTRPSAVASPTVTGPVTGGMGKPNLLSTSFDLATVGYTSNEYFLAGKATAYSSSQPLTPDGRWSVQPATTQPYATRAVVYRPSDPKRFNGTVFVEWLNVTAGFDSPPDWLSGHVALIRDGAAWVGVDAQSVGVQGGAATVAGLPGGGLKAADPARYGPLSHPGDGYSYDIFSQAGIAARSPATTAPLGGLKARRVIAVGESQSAFRLVTYINAVQPRAHVYDGFLVHSRWGTGAPLSQAPQPNVAVPGGTVIRRDTTVPVLTFETETDLLHGYVSARQADSRRFRDWEIAGTAHADAYTAGGGFGDTGDGMAEAALLDVGAVGGGPLRCGTPINNGPAYLVLHTALHDLDRWVRDGTAPPVAPRLDVTSSPSVAVRRDVHGNALGGVRTPVVDAPTAALQGDTNTGGSFCGLFGTTMPFDAATLSSLYPTHADYVTKFGQAMRRALKNGFLLPRDAQHLTTAAAQSTIR